MAVIIQHNAMIPVYEQIVTQLKKEILAGKLAEGAALPSVRVLAKDLTVSALTVKKAYDLLEADGFTKTVHGKGSYVLPVNVGVKKEEMLVQIQAELETTLKKARQAGLTRAELLELTTMILEDETHD